MKKKDPRFDILQMTGPELSQMRKNNHRISLERRVVKKLLLRTGLNALEISVRAPPEDDDYFQTCAWLVENYNNLPIHLVSTDVSQDTRLDDFWGPKARSSLLWQNWSTILSMIEGKAAGCICEVVTSHRVFDMILHNLEMPFMPEDHEREYVMLTRRTASGKVSFLETVEDFSDRLASVWTAI